MKKRVVCLVLVLALVFGFNTFTKPVSAADVDTVSFSVLYKQTDARNMLSLINTYRANNGRYEDSQCPLAYDYDLEKVAMQRAADLVVRFNTDHKRPDGQSYEQTLADFGFNISPRYAMYGENVLFGTQNTMTLENAFSKLTEKDETRKIILGYFTHVGIAHVKMEDNIDFWVQVYTDEGQNETYTSPVDGDKKVSVKVLNSYANDVSVEYDSGAKAVAVGSTVSAPVYIPYVKFSGSELEDKLELSPLVFESEDYYVKASGGNMTGLHAGTGKISAALLGRTFEYDITVTGGSSLAITTQPANISVKEGTQTSFSVAASGSGLKYQWQVSKNGGTSWVNSSMSGYNTNTLSVNAIAERNGYMFRCVVSDNAGNSVTSNAATLTVQPSSELKITKQPSDATVTAGTNAKFSITASGSGIKYQWQASKDGGNTWVNSGMKGYNTNTLTVAANIDRNGYKFRCIITDKLGNKLTSNAAKLSIKADSELKITAHPSDVTVASGTNAKFSITASGSGIKYQWQTSKDGGNTWVNSGMTGYNTNTLTVAANIDRNGYKFRCVVTDNVGNKLTSNAATLKIKAETELKITKQPSDVTVTSGTNTTFSITASGSGIKYQWQTSKDGGNTWVNSGMTGYNTNTLTVAANIDRNGYKFRCVVTDNVGNKVTSSAATLKIKSETELKITSHPENVTAAPGNLVTFSITASGSGIRYQWQTSKDGGNTWINSGMTGYNTNNLSVVVNADRNGYKFRCVVTDNVGNQVASNAATLSVKSDTELIISSQPSDVTADSGDTATFSITASGSGIRYQWQTSKDGGNTWVNSGMQGYNTNTLTVAVNADRNGYKFRCVVTDSVGNMVTSNAATLNVK